MSVPTELQSGGKPASPPPRRILDICLATALCWFGMQDTATTAAEPLAASTRRPIALVAVKDYVVVANRRSGSLSYIDTATHSVVGEQRVAGRIADLVAKSDGSGVLVLDDDQRRVLEVQIKRGKSGPESITRSVCQLPMTPVKLILAPKPQRLFVSSRWSRSVVVVDLPQTGLRPVRLRTIPLGFPAQEMALINKASRLVVADAFGGRLAIIDVQRAVLQQVRQLNGHNIRGLALSHDGSNLYVTHQQLNPTGWTDFDDVHWGTLMANSLRVLKLDSLLDRNKNILEGGWLEKLGRTGHAAGDPGPVVMGDRGTMAVALSGVGDVAVTRASYADRFHVGRRPVDLIIVNDNLLIADQLSDAIARIDLRAGAVAPKIALGPTAALTARDRGEALFYNARLSHDGWMSCHSCHSEGHTIDQLADTLGDGDYGAPKRIPSLLGSGQSGPWAWTGAVLTLQEQVQKSVKTTMHGGTLSKRKTNDIVAFLKSLPPPATRFTAAPEQLRQGEAVFAKRGCVDCHPAPLYTSTDSVDVGLVDENGRRKFNPPSLRGLGQRDRFFHDGRANRVEDVVLQARHQLGTEKLSASEAAALIAFLKSL